MKQLLKWNISTGITVVFCLLTVGCGKSVTVDSGSSSSNLLVRPVTNINPITTIPAIPVVGTGPVTCLLYDLSPYWISQGCPIPLNDPSNPLPGPGVNLNSIVSCNMKLPDDFSTLSPVAIMNMEKFDVGALDWSHGLPGMTGKLAYLREWYGLSCTGTLTIPKDDAVNMTLTSDDGARLFIDGRLAVNNDGLRAPSSTSGVDVLVKGPHKFRLDWFQGPRNLIALQLAWINPGTGINEIIPASAFGAVDNSPACR